MFGRQKVATLVAEFLGTGILTLLLLSVQRSQVGLPFFVSIAAGLVLLLLTLVFSGVSGAHLNPAITIGMWTARKIQTLTAALYIVMQMLGGWAAYYLFTYFVKTSFASSGGHFEGRILVAEAVGTAIFSMGLAAAIYQGYSRAVTAAIAGLSFMVGIVTAATVLPTVTALGGLNPVIGLLNPAVALGERAFVWGTYVLGPVLGAVIGINLYGLLFASPEALVATTTTATAVTETPEVVETVVTKRTTAKKRPVAKKRVTRK